jgi:hypothetical protein
MYRTATNKRETISKNFKNSAAVTIASRRYFALARVTAESFIEHNPDIRFYILITDDFDPPALAAGIAVLRLQNLNIENIQSLCFRYSELELSYALTPHVIKHLLGIGYNRVLFLKQETLVLHQLSAVFNALTTASVVVTPHFLKPSSRPDALSWEQNVLRSGIFNGGLIGFSNMAESHLFLSWWQQRTSTECVLDVDNGIHYEQRWLDFLPSFMPHWQLCDDPGVNVGHWNIFDRKVTWVDDHFEVDNHILKVFRFSGFEYDRPEQLTRYDVRPVSDLGDAKRIVYQYLDALHAADHHYLQRETYLYDRYDNGQAISPLHRQVYRKTLNAEYVFGDPFTTQGANSYFVWIKRHNSFIRRLFRRILKTCGRAA